MRPPWREPNTDDTQHSLTPEPGANHASVELWSEGSGGLDVKLNPEETEALWVCVSLSPQNREIAGTRCSLIMQVHNLGVLNSKLLRFKGLHWKNTKHLLFLK